MEHLGRLSTWVNRNVLRPRWYVVGSLVALILSVAFVFAVLPPLMVDGKDFAHASARVKAENDIRTTGVQAVGGLALAIGAVFAGITLAYNREQQITERFTRAIDQLDQSGALDVRVGGIYALERIMRDSKRDHGAIVEVLAAFIRTHSVEREKLRQVARTNETPNTQDHPDDGRAVAADIQAALTVLGRRPSHPELELDRLRLSDSVLGGALIRKADLRCVGLRHANLEHAHLEGTNLEGARMRGAKLGKASLQGARLQWASLVGANLEGASLKEARMDHARLTRAVMSPTTKLDGATFEGAHLAGVKGGPPFTSEQLREAHCRPDQTACDVARSEIPPRGHRCHELETLGSSYYDDGRADAAAASTGPSDGPGEDPQSLRARRRQE